MSENSTTTYALAAGMGAIAGMRSMSAPALLSRHLSQQKGRDGSVVRLLASRRAARVLTLLAGGEMVADKTPFVPSRTEPPSLAGRTLAGALSGAAIAGRRGGSQVGAALLGAATAVGSTHLAYNLRVEAGRRSGIPDAVLGFVEDAIVWAAGSRLASAVG